MRKIPIECLGLNLVASAAHWVVASTQADRMGGLGARKHLGTTRRSSARTSSEPQAFKPPVEADRPSPMLPAALMGLFANKAPREESREARTFANAHLAEC